MSPAPLNQPEKMERLDPSDMLGKVVSLPGQFLDARRRAQGGPAALSSKGDPAGAGGGFGGDRPSAGTC